MGYSEKALRQVKGAPPQGCGEHPDTTYVEVPAHVRPHMAEDYRLGCVECVKALTAKVEAEEMDTKRKRWAKERAVEAAIKARQGDAMAAQGKLQETYAQVVNWKADHATRLERTAAEVARRTKQVQAARTDIKAREAELLEARQRLAQARAGLKGAQMDLDSAKSHQEAAQAEPACELGGLQDALTTCEEAFAACRPRFKRKKIDRRLHKRARKMLAART